MRRDNGITLIALIITIIILVILAAVSIRAVTNMGIVGHAINGTQQYAQKAVEENAILDNTTTLMESTIQKLHEILSSEAKKETDENWSIAWNWDGTHWSNPYFKDSTLESQFTFTGIDESYSLSSEEDLDGDIIALLYENSETSLYDLYITGVGAMGVDASDGSNGGDAWLGSYHALGEFEGITYDYYEVDWGFHDFLSSSLGALIIGEGITSLPERCFGNSLFRSVDIPSSMNYIGGKCFEECYNLNTVNFSPDFSGVIGTTSAYGEESPYTDAFGYTAWLDELDGDQIGHYDNSVAGDVVEVDVNGVVWKFMVWYE